MLGFHKKVRYKPYKMTPHEESNDLELMFLALQKVIRMQHKSTGKKGVIVDGNKITYAQLQGMLFALHTKFGMQGAFTNRGICAGCEKFVNSGSSSTQHGYCGSNEKWCFDVCDMVKSED